MGEALFLANNPPKRDYACGFYRCDDFHLLRGRRAISRLLRESLQAAGIDTLGSVSYKSENGGGGVTAVEIIGASCADIHTLPEFGTAIIRCFACGDKDKEIRDFLCRLKRRLNPKLPYIIPERSIPVVLPTPIPLSWKLLLSTTQLVSTQAHAEAENRAN